MIPLLTAVKRSAGRKPDPILNTLDISKMHQLLTEQNVGWRNVVLSFNAMLIYTNAIKSLKQVVKHSPFLQPHYGQGIANPQLLRIDPLTEQDFAQASQDKVKKLVSQWARLIIDSADQNLESALAQVTEIVQKYPTGAYKYAFRARFNGCHFGSGTLDEMPESYMSGRQEFFPIVTEQQREDVKNNYCNFVELRLADKHSSVVVSCLLQETDSSTQVERLELPEGIIDFVSILGMSKENFKLKGMNSIPELRAIRDEQYCQIAKRTGASIDHLRQQRNHYGELSSDERINLELALFRHLNSRDFTERDLSPQASEREKSFYVAILFLEVNNSARNKIEEVTKMRMAAAEGISKGTFESFAALDISNPLLEKVLSFMSTTRARADSEKQAAIDAMMELIDNKRLPHDLSIATVPFTGTREQFDRKKILLNIFTPLGYRHVKQSVGSVGVYEFKKEFLKQDIITCAFDFGTWRQTISGGLSFSTADGRGTVSVPIRYCRDGEMPITTEDLFIQSFENIACVVRMLEENHMTKFRDALKEARLV